MSSNSQINVNSFRDKIRIKCTLYFHSYSKSHCFWRNLLRWQKIYTAAGSDGSDKSHLCLGVNIKKVQLSPPSIICWLFKVNTWKLGSVLVWRGCCWSLRPSSQIVIVKSVDCPSLPSSLPMPCRSYKHGLNPMIDWALRCESSTLILYKELSSSIFQSLSVSQASVTPDQISTLFDI